MYKFTFSINKDDIFKSSLNYLRSQKTFIFDIIFTGAALIAIFYYIATNSFSMLSNLYKVLLIFCALLFPIVQPIILYIKSCIHAEKIKEYKVTMEFNEDGIYLSSNTDKSEVKYENIYNFIKYKNMIVVMYDSIHGQIMPDRIFNENKDEFFDYVCSKIKYAREKQKEE